jgi:hypothetical protein
MSISGRTQVGDYQVTVHFYDRKVTLFFSYVPQEKRVRGRCPFCGETKDDLLSFFVIINSASAEFGNLDPDDQLHSAATHKLKQALKKAQLCCDTDTCRSKQSKMLGELIEQRM